MCRNYRSKYNRCKDMHFISVPTLEKLILTAIRRVGKKVLENEEEFLEVLRDINEQNRSEEIELAKSELQKKRIRNEELDLLIKKLYESNTLGIIPDRQFDKLMKDYIAEQTKVEAEIKEYESILNEDSPEKIRAGKFVALVKKYSDFTELTDRMIYEFIDRIDIHSPIGGRTNRSQKVDIYFNFIGQFEVPVTEEELQKEALEQEKMQAEKERQKKERLKENAKRCNEKKAKKRAKLKGDAEAGDPIAKAEYEELLRKEAERREQQRPYYREHYRKKKEEYQQIKELAEKGDSRAIEKLAELDKKIANEKKRISERGKAKRRAMKESIAS